MNLDDKQSKGTHCVSLFFESNMAAYFDSLCVEYSLQFIPQHNRR